MILFLCLYRSLSSVLRIGVFKPRIPSWGSRSDNAIQVLMPDSPLNFQLPT